MTILFPFSFSSIASVLKLFYIVLLTNHWKMIMVFSFNSCINVLVTQRDAQKDVIYKTGILNFRFVREWTWNCHMHFMRFIRKCHFISLFLVHGNIQLCPTNVVQKSNITRIYQNGRFCYEISDRPEWVHVLRSSQKVAVPSFRWHINCSVFSDPQTKKNKQKQTWSWFPLFKIPYFTLIFRLLFPYFPEINVRSPKPWGIIIEHVKKFQMDPNLKENTK